jgi:hypothetical protein
MKGHTAMTTYTGDEHDHWNDTGPCPACGEPDCWLGCLDDDEGAEQ